MTVTNHVLERVEAGDWQLQELSIEILNECRAKCKHCSSGAGVSMRDELITEEILSAVAQGRDLGATVLSLSGGDPILHPELLLIIGYALDLGYEQVLLYTTGVWQTDEDVLFRVPPGCGDDTRRGVWPITAHPALQQLLDLSKRGLVFVFSLDSADPTIMDYVRGVPGMWYAVTQGIKFLTRTGVTVWVHYVPMRVNVEEVHAVRDLCCELGVEKMSLLRFVPQTRGLANEDALLPTMDQFRWLMRHMDYEFTHPDRVNLPTAIRMGCPISFRHAEKDTSIHKAGIGKVKLCHAGTDLILIRPNGAIHPCAAWKSLPTDTNIRSTSLAEVWDGDATFQAIRDYLQTEYAELDGDCGMCKDLFTCRGGCPAQRLHAFGKSLVDLLYPAPDPMCPRRYWRAIGREDV